MKIFTSALEGVTLRIDGEKLNLSEYMVNKGIELKWNLMSYYYLKKNYENAQFIKRHSESVIIDSGAHTFQFGIKVDWDKYVEEYASFIEEFDEPNVVGYFEMDVENVTGYSKVLDMRKELERVTNKIIPVWHPLRGINEYEKMCYEYSGKVIAIGGFRNTDIRDEQYLMFLKVARKYNCKVHCLGMTRQQVLDKCPFHFTDSATWLTATNMGNIITEDGKRQTSKVKFPRSKGLEKFEQYATNYRNVQRMQEHYHNKWKKECND